MGENQSWVFPTRSDTNWSMRLQNMTRSLKFRIMVEEESYCLCIKNKGADQPCSYCDADLCLCFGI